MSDPNLSPAARALLTELQGSPTATQFDADAAQELIGCGYAVIVPGGALLEITEAGQRFRPSTQSQDE